MTLCQIILHNNGHSGLAKSNSSLILEWIGASNPLSLGKQCKLSYITFVMHAKQSMVLLRT